MELSRSEVPLYGRVKVSATLPATEDEARFSEEVEFYIVLEGSTLNHVTVAQRAEEGHILYFIVPGHNLFEVVCITAYLYIEGRAISCLNKASLEYVQDDAQELAEFLLTHYHCLSTSSHKDIISKFRLGDEADHRKMDENVTQAMANLDYPYSWNVLGSQPGEELQPKETLLHLAVRLGLSRLLQLLLCQPGGLMAVALPNEEGDTPLLLAQRSGRRGLLELLNNPPNPLATPLAGMSQVWADSSRLLRFCHETETLTLTVQQISSINQQTAILLLRKCLRDDNFLREIKALSRSGLEEEYEREDSEGSTNMKDSRQELCRQDHTMEDKVSEEQFSLFSVEEQPTPEKNPIAPFRSPTAQSTYGAATRLSAMLNGKDQIYANYMLVDQVNDMGIKYNITGVTGDCTPTEGGRQGPGPGPGGGAVTEMAAAFQTSGPVHWEEKEAGEQWAAAAPSPWLSPVGAMCGHLNDLARTDRLIQGGSSLQETCALRPCCSTHSPSLVALQVDSEEDDQLDQWSFPHTSTPPQVGGALQASSGDERDSFDASPDLNCGRTHSSSFNNAPIKRMQKPMQVDEKMFLQDSEEPGVRLRSYSYSSPKTNLVRPCLNRDIASDLSEDGVFSSTGRSLLQALSLSKSLSLLSPVKQPTFSLSEQPQKNRELSFRKRAQSAEDEGNVALAESLQHLTLSEFLKEIEEEEWDKYIIPSKAESEKYKVSRTFSFLKSRMSSTRNRNKGKAKEREGKEKGASGHQFVAGSCSGLTLCLVCDKPAMGKDLLHCSNCTINVHKGCRDAATPCMKKLQEKYAVTVKNKAASLPQNTAVPCSVPTSASLPAIMSRERRDQAAVLTSLSKSVPVVTERRLSEGQEVESEAWRSRSQSEELLPVMESSPSTDSSLIEDMHFTVSSSRTPDVVDSPLRNDFRVDLLDYEPESWSLAVEHKFCKKHEKRVIKRQDVIYELMQTEIHHIQTLIIMAEIFRKGMKEELQLDMDTVDKIFPCLDELLDFHKGFFCAMKERRQACTQENSRNFLIDRIGDILVQQFSCDNAEKMKLLYGEFCSHHTEAVSFFKELQQQNKKFQVFIKQQSYNSLVRRKEIPECILLVTQRITKYPVLLERILQYSQEGTEEHSDLSRALGLIREVIAAVDLKVSEYEKEQKLLDILNRMENKTFAKLKNGHTFRKQDLLIQARTLKHEGLVYWKTATGRLKDILALLLTDTLIFLQEKDQKFIFAAVDQKPPVISLQKLIVREVANEERGMFLISASAAGPEMYEVHTASKEERNSWMRLIREAVDSCPEEEEENTSESEEDKRATEARALRIQKLQETLNLQDQQICASLEEKLKIYSELMRMNVNEEIMPEEIMPEPRLLVQLSPEEMPQAAVLLMAALREAEKLKATLMSRTCSLDNVSQESLAEPGSPRVLSDVTATGSIQGSPTESDYSNTQSSTSVSQTSESESREVEWTATDAVILSLNDFKRGDANNINLKVAQSVQSLTQLLYSLQAAVVIQDSCFEVQRALLQESERVPRANALQEQEKQRNLEKQREELAGVLRLREQLRQEQQRWERECHLRRCQHEGLAGQLEQRERECQLQAQRLQCERDELEVQLREYQQSLERLREGQRLVSRQRHQLETQQRLLQSWRHSRQRSLPVMVIPLDNCQEPGHRQCSSFGSEGSVLVNEAALHASQNNRHLPQHQRSASLVSSNMPSCHMARPILDGKHTPQHLPAHSHTSHPLPAPAARINNDVNTLSFNSDKWPMGTALIGPTFYQGFPNPHVGPLTSPPGDMENGEEGAEENIVYL
ncbi:rho guanine nucleotide exchange factor 28 isoform X2 [Scleropages formosus]|uniref:rho guanine nucleotide exchange factor 28 isoform X2 n=1 Tax=Scleropages formosus TaxID=113540 RepID=UPI0010FA6685|nr:rho guanine nucleotide exchange factor 28 isoform X2 [Scleropages formosus]